MDDTWWVGLLWDSKPEYGIFTRMETLNDLWEFRTIIA